MQRKKPLLVTLDATQPSIIELTTHETLQLDRVVRTPRGRVAERHGALVAPGTTRLALDAGQFCFRTLSNADLRVVQGGVAVHSNSNSKDVPPPAPGGDTPVAHVRGDEPDGDQPILTVS